MTRYLFLVIALLLFSCKEGTVKKEKEVTTEANSSYYQEPYRPQFHFSPPTRWMNDPNGLVYHKGLYHLFYQYYPEDIVWGPMHWGHATSEDLVSWKHKPIALYPDELGYIFSGSAVVDTQNTSGLGTEENPPLVAIFTYHLMQGEKAGRKDFQTQGIAFSLDNGDTWQKFDGNPVIGNKDIKDFRDPKVFWHDESNQWILALVAGDHAKFYSSPNLIDWTLKSEFGRTQGAHGGVWECPDLFPLKVEGTGEEKWVLIISINPGAPNGGSGTQYFVGDFDGTTFTTSQTAEKWLDAGRDNYAGVTYNNTPTEERVFIGWMSNWDYAQKTPTEVWRSAMTLPRTLTLHQDEGGYFVKNYPVSRIASIASEVSKKDIISLQEPFAYSGNTLMASEWTFTVNLSEELTINLANDTKEQVQFQLNPILKELLFDRTNSGWSDAEAKFAGPIQKQAYRPEDREVEFRMIVDASSIEIFIDKGKYVFTNQVFPKQPYQKLEISSNSAATLTQFNHLTLNSIWNNE